MTDRVLKIGDAEIQPGVRRIVNIPIARLYTNNWAHMPVSVIHSEKPGPVLFVCAAQHGDEVNGVEIIRRLVKHRSLRHMKGTLLAVPIVNVFGFLQGERYLPDRRDLNRSYPGSSAGSLASRMAHMFLEEIVSHSTHGIDLHTAAAHRYNLPQIRADLADPETLAMGRVFGAPVMIHSRKRNKSLREEVAKRGIPIIVYEVGEALRFNENGIQLGVEGIIRVMRHIGMLRKGRKQLPEPVRTSDTRWVRAKKSGLVRLKYKAGKRVKRHETIAVITDPLGTNVVDLKAPFDGVIIGHTNLPLVNAGDAVVHVARAKLSPEIVEEIEQLEE